MKRRIELWGIVGFIVAGCWVILSLAIPISEQPILWYLARLTCPIVPVSMALHFGVKWYWVIVSNVVAYALIGLMVEALLQSRNRFQAAPR
jgi:predicted membrane chloride channel (bestrophin family)